MDDIDPKEWIRKLEAGRQKFSKYKKKKNSKVKGNSSQYDTTEEQYSSLDLTKDTLRSNAQPSDTLSSAQSNTASSSSFLDISQGSLSDVTNESFLTASCDRSIAEAKDSTEFSAKDISFGELSSSNRDADTSVSEGELTLEHEKYVTPSGNLSSVSSVDNKSEESVAFQSCSEYVDAEISVSEGELTLEHEKYASPYGGPATVSSDGNKSKGDNTSQNCTDFANNTSVSEGELSVNDYSNPPSMISLENLDTSEHQLIDPVINMNLETSSSGISMIKAVEKYEKRIKEFQKAVDQRDGIIKQLTERLEASIESPNEIQEDAAFVQREVEQVSDFLKKQKDKFTELTTEELLMERRKNEELNRNIKQKEQLLEQMSRQVKSLANELFNTKSVGNQQNEVHMKNLNDMQVERQNLLSEKQRTAKEVQGIMSENERLHKELYEVNQNYKIDKEKFSIELEKQRADLDEQHGYQITMMKEDIRRTFTDELNILKDEIKIQLNVIDEVKGECLNKATMIENYEKELDTSKINHKNELENLKKVFALTNEDLSEQIHRLNKSLEDQKEDTMNYRQTSENDKAKLKKLQQSFEEKSEQLSDLQMKISPLHDENNDLKELLSRLEDKLREKESDNFELVNSLEAVTSEGNSLKRKLNEIENSLINAKNDYSGDVKLTSSGLKDSGEVSVGGNKSLDALEGALKACSEVDKQGLHVIKNDAGVHCDNVLDSSPSSNFPGDQNIFVNANNPHSFCDQSSSPVRNSVDNLPVVGLNSSQDSASSMKSSLNSDVPQTSVHNDDGLHRETANTFDASTGDKEQLLDLSRCEEEAVLTNEENRSAPCSAENKLLEEKMEMENQKEIILRSQISQLKDMCNSYNVVQTELKSEIQNLNRKYQDFVDSHKSQDPEGERSTSLDPSSSSFSNLDRKTKNATEEDFSNCKNCAEVYSKLEAEILLKDLIIKNSELNLKEYQIEKKHIMSSYGLKQQEDAILFQAKLVDENIQRMNSIKDDLTRDFSWQLDLHKQKFERQQKSSYNFQIEQMKNEYELQIKKIESGYKNRIAEISKSSNKKHMESSQEDLKLHVDRLIEMKKLTETQLENIKPSLSPTQLAATLELYDTIKKIQMEELSIEQAQLNNKVQVALEEERLRLRTIQDSEIEFLRVEADGSKIKALHNMKEKLSKEHQQELLNLEESFQTQIKDLESRSVQSQNNAVNVDFENVIYEDVMQMMKQQFNSDLHAAAVDASKDWMSSYLSSVMNVDDQLAATSPTSESNTSFEVLLKSKERLIQCAEDMNRYVDSILKKPVTVETSLEIVNEEVSSPKHVEIEREYKELEEKMHAKTKEIEGLVGSHSLEITKMKLDHDQHLKMLAIEISKENTDLQKRLSKQTEALALKDKKFEQDVEKLIAKLEGKYELEIEKIREYYEKQLSQASFVQEWNESLDTSVQLQYTKQQVDEMKEDEERKYKEKLSNVIHSNKESQQNLEQLYQAKIDELQQDHITQMKNLEQEYNTNITRIQMECATQSAFLIDEQRNDVRNEMSQAFHEKQHEIEKLMRQSEDVVTQLKMSHEEQVSSLKADYESKLVQVEDDHKASVDDLKKEHDDVMQTVVQKNEEAIEEMKQRLEAEHSNKVEELMQQIKELQDSHEKYKIESKDQVKNMNEKKNMELSALRNEIEANWRERVQLIQSDLTMLADKDKKNLILKHSETNDALNDKIKEKCSELSIVEQRLVSSRDTIKDLENKLKVEVENNASNMVKHQEELDALQLLIQEREREQDSMKLSLDQTLNDFQLQEDRIQELENKLSKEAEIVMLDYQEKHKKEIKLYDDRILQKNSEMEALKVKLNELTDTCEEQKETIDGLQNKIQTENERLIQEASMKMDQMSKELKEEANATILANDVAHKEKMEEFVNKISAKESELKLVSEKADELEKTCDLQKQTIKDLEKKMENLNEQLLKEASVKMNEMIKKLEEETQAALMTKDAKHAEELNSLNHQFENELKRAQQQMERDRQLSNTNINKQVNDELVKLKSMLDKDSNKEKLQQLVTQVASLKSEVKVLKDEKELCDQQIQDEIKRYEEVMSCRERENVQFGNFISALQAERDTVQQSNAHLMQILSELVRTFISIEDIINRHLKGCVKEEPKTSEQAETADLSLEELGDIVEFNEEGLDLIPERLPDEIFRGPSIDLIGEDVIYGVGKRVFAAVEDLLTKIPVIGAEVVAECTKCHDADMILEQLQLETNAKELLALELHKAKGLLSGYEAEKNSLEVEKQDLEQKIQALSAQLEQSKHQAKELTSDKQHLSSQVQTLSHNVGDIEKKLFEENNRLNKQMRLESQQQEQNMQEFRKKIHDMEATSEERILYYDGVIEHKNIEISDYERQIEAMEKQIKADKKFLEEVTLEREQERDDFQKELEKLHNMIKEKEKVQNVEKVLSKQVEALEEQLFEQIAEQNEHDFQRETLISELNNCQAELRNNKSIIADLEAQLELKSKSEEQLQQELQKIKLVLSHNCEFQEELNSEIVLLRQSSVSPTANDDSELISCVSALNEQVKQMRHSLSIFEDFKAQIQVIHQKLDHKNRELQMHQSAMTSDETLMLNEHHELKIKSPSTDDVRELGSPDDVHQLDDKIENMLLHVENIVALSEELKAKLELSKAAEEELLQDKQQLQKELDNQRLQVSALRSSMQQRQQVISSPKKRKDPEIEEELVQERERRLSLEKKITELELDFENTGKELQSQLTSSVHSVHDLTQQVSLMHQVNGDLKSEIEELKDKLKSIPENAETVIREKTLRNDYLESQVNLLNLQLDKLQEEVAKCDHKWENEQVDAICAKHEENVNKLSTCLQEKEDSVTALKQQEKDLRLQLLDKDTFLKSKLEEMKSYKEKWQNTKAEVSSSRKKQIEASNQLENAVIRCDKLNNERQSLQAQISELQANVGSLKEQVDIANRVVDAARNEELKHKAKLSDLLEQLQTKSKEDEDKKRFLKEKDDKIENLVKDMATERQSHQQELLKFKLEQPRKSRDDGIESRNALKFGGIPASETSSCNSSVSVSTENIENLLPGSVIRLLNKVHESGLQLLTLSELETLRKHLSLDTDCTCLDRKQWAKEISVLKSEIDHLKLLLSQINSGNGDPDKYIELIGQIFSKERSLYCVNVDSHLASNSCTHNDEYKMLKQQLDSLESHQTLAMDNITKVCQHNKFNQMTSNFPEQEHYQEECRKLTKQIAALEQHASITEWKLKRQIEFLMYKVEKENVISSETQASLDDEKGRIIEVTGEINKLKNKCSQLEHQLSLAVTELAKVQHDLVRSHGEISELRAIYDAEKTRNQSLVHILESERSNFSQLQETVDSERRLSAITETRHKQLIEELRESVDSERNLSMQMKQKLNESLNLSQGPIHNDSGSSTIPEKRRSDSRSSSGSQQMVVDDLDIHESIQSPERSFGMPTGNFSQFSNDSAKNEHLANECRKHKFNSEKLTQELIQLKKHMETDKQKKEILQMRIQDLEKDKDNLIQTSINLQQELESFKKSHKQFLNNHNSYLEKQGDAQQTMEIKYEQQRQKMRDLEVDLERKNQDIRIMKMKFEGSNDHQLHLTKELDLANERIGMLTSLNDGSHGNQQLHRMETIRQKLLLIANNCRVENAEPGIADKFSSFVNELQNCQVDQLSSGSDFTEKLVGHNTELTTLVSNLSNDKLKLKNELVKLEDQLINLRQSHLVRTHDSSNKITAQKLALERSAWAQERAELHLALHRAESDLRKKPRTENEFPSNSSIYSDEFKRYYTKYLRAESFRKALVYQKKYLLILLGSYQDTEKVTLSMVAKMGAFPSSFAKNIPLLPTCTPHSRAFVRFRSAATVIISISRMKYLVRRWSNVASRAAVPMNAARGRFDQNINGAHNEGSHELQPQRWDKMNSNSDYPPLIRKSDRNVDSENCSCRLQYVQQALGLHSSFECSD